MMAESTDQSNFVDGHRRVDCQSPPIGPKSDETLQVGLQIHSIGGMTGRALAAAQGLALRTLLASVDQTEVRPGQEPFP
jgi:hypothetical protein